VNARLSRSSALASKATGYPLAYVAAKLALGHDLVSLRNNVTKTTTACFEPALDYCVVKVPRWDLKKFGSRVDTRIGSAMKSVGEVMSIGRSFEEAIQKAVRMVNPNLAGFGPPPSFSPAEPYFGILSPSAVQVQRPKTATGATPVAAASATPQAAAKTTPGSGPRDAATASPRLKGMSSRSPTNIEELGNVTAVLDEKLRVPCDTRLMDIAVAFEVGYTVERVHELTKIDNWFLTKLERITRMARALELVDSLEALPVYSLRRLKHAGFSDKQIAHRLGTSEIAVRACRKSHGIVPVVKQIDTLAAEFPAVTNYLYMTYGGTHDDVPPAKDSIIVLGGGPYCIGSSVEFDWCAVSAIRTLRSAGVPTIMINCNPETVSTDYDESDRLYFDELTLERTLDIYERDQAGGVIVSVGGQIPNNLAMPLLRQGAKILGTSPVDIDKAEDRNKFSKLLDALGVDQPQWKELVKVEDVKDFADTVGYPVLVRPSYVLSGAAMKVAGDEEQLRACLAGAAVVSPDHPVVVSKFIMGAKEIEFDGVAKDGRVLNYAISEHVENAGVHSGDATLVLPAQKLYVETIRQVKKIASGIAKALSISGPFNIQFMSRDNEVKVIECNLRASRTFPFISKTFDFNFISLATRVMAGLPAKQGHFSLVDLDYVGVKAPQFSFTRLQGADPTLGVEMVSTGEVACFGVDMYEAFLLALVAAGFKLPLKTRNVLFALGSHGKPALIDCVRRLQALGYNIFATEGTKLYCEAEGVMNVTALAKPSADKGPGSVYERIASRQLDLVINEPEVGDKEATTDGYLIRRAAVDYGVPLITNAKVAILLSLALERMHAKKGSFTIRSMEDYYAAAAAL
jgi:carbamoyl-phosphate synthase large subunit